MWLTENRIRPNCLLMTMFDEFGQFTGSIPDECVRQCTKPGTDALVFVQFWCDLLGFVVDRDQAIEYLDCFGAWTNLRTASTGELSIRCLWLACNDIAENGEWLGLIY